MGLLEARESAARVRVEEMRAEAGRVLAELAEAEAVLERRVVALAELVEALTAGAVPQEPVQPAPVPVPVKAPVDGSVVPKWREGVTALVLAPEYRRLLGVLEADSGREGLRLHHVDRRHRTLLVFDTEQHSPQEMARQILAAAGLPSQAAPQPTARDFKLAGPGPQLS
ncbi:hypothetical protein ACIA8E_37415 [Streptomyces sp. NPDC051664]|uniref:hypothetical protein n=1 Tax=Streptomyces sp. NPDC051664 TaxID=3365668 RepID=UPI0037A3D273